MRALSLVAVYATMIGLAGCDIAPPPRSPEAALAQAEFTCEGLPSEARGGSFVEAQGPIVAVAPATRPETVGKITRYQVVGATIHVRANPGVTPEWLERVGKCHAAMAAAGRGAAEGPLAVPGADVRVASIGGGFAISIVSDEPGAGEEIVRRTRAAAASARAGGGSSTFLASQSPRRPTPPR